MEKTLKIEKFADDSYGTTITMTKLGSLVGHFYSENGFFPERILLHIEDFMFYPLLLNDPNLNTISDIRFRGITIQPYK